jgi:hypothetical protein
MRPQLERELENHRLHKDALPAKKKEWEDAKLALAEHQKNHDNQSRSVSWHEWFSWSVLSPLH